MAGTITWDELRELAAFTASRGCAISLYLDLDPSVTPTPKDIQARVDSLLHGARDGLPSDIDRIRRWFHNDFDRAGIRGIAVFAAGLDNLWRTIECPEAVADDVRTGDELYLAPLMPLVGRGDSALVAFVGRERGHVFKLESGRLVEIAHRTDGVPGRHDQGGWSQARYERHIETLVDRHLRRVADTLDRCVRRLGHVRVVLVGTEDVRPEFDAMLAHETRACVLGWTSVEAHTDGVHLLAAVQPMLDAWWTGRESEVIDRWREEAARNGRAAAGWEETLEAASDGRVDMLLVQSGADHPAYECPKCGRAQVTNGSCPIDGTAMESREAGLDVAVHKTLVNGGTVQVIRERRDLEPVGGLGALLRF